MTPGITVTGCIIVIVIVIAIGLELTARRTPRVVTFGEMLAVALRRPAVRLLLQAGWLWIGWHGRLVGTASVSATDSAATPAAPSSRPSTPAVSSPILTSLRLNGHDESAIGIADDVHGIPLTQEPARRADSASGWHAARMGLPGDD